jgi:hypothetical protein
MPLSPMFCPDKLQAMNTAFKRISRVRTPRYSIDQIGNIERSRRQQSSLPGVQHCYDCANRCLDLWNDSVDHTIRSELLRMACAWLNLAFELAEQGGGERSRRRFRRHIVEACSPAGAAVVSEIANCCGLLPS